MNEDAHGCPDARHHDSERDAANTMLELMQTQLPGIALSGGGTSLWDRPWERAEPPLWEPQERLPSLETWLQCTQEGLRPLDPWTPLFPRIDPLLCETGSLEILQVSQEPLPVSAYATSSDRYSSHPETSLTPNSSFKCAFFGCSSSFQRRTDLFRHMNSLHRENEMPMLPCPVPDCPRVKEFGFRREDKLTDHLRSVHGKDIPKKTLTIDAVSQLEGNSTIVQDSTIISALADGPYTPGDRLFGKETSSFPCSYPDCSKTFRRKGDLNRHLRTHTDSRRFQCSMCKKEFTLPKDLSRHEKTHGDKSEPRYRCSIAGCHRNKLGEAFKQMDDLKRHIELIHPGAGAYAITSSIKLSCVICGHEASRKDNLLRHMRKQHAASAEYVQLKPVAASNK